MLQRACYLLMALVLFAPPAHGGLVLNIDSTTEEVFFSGDLQGRSQHNFASSPRFIFWDIGDLSNDPESPDSTSLLDLNVLSIKSGPNADLIGLRFFDDGLRFFIRFATQNSLVDVEGTGNRSSYADASDAQKNFFEGLIGDTIPHNSAIGSATDVSVAGIAAVPEPTAPLTLGVIAALAIARRASKAKANRGNGANGNLTC